MKKKLLLVVITIVSIFTLAGCSYLDQFTSISDKKIGILMPSQELERWYDDGYFLENQFTQQGYEVSLRFSDDDVNKQIQDIQELIDAQMDVLIIAAIDSNALSEILEEAKQNEIIVVSYDRLIMDTDAVSYNVTFDNYMVGQLQAQHVIDTLGLNTLDSDKLDGVVYNMEFTTGDANDNNALLFYQGAMDLLTPYIEAGIIQVPSGQVTFSDTTTELWKEELAHNRMSEILAEYYSDGTQLDIALCTNDTTALGVTNAIIENYSGSNTPIITGQDGDEANLKNLIDGKQSMDVYKAFSNEAAVTFNLVVSILMGEKPNASLISLSGWSFKCSYDTETYNNGIKNIPSFLIEPESVTINNYMKILVESGYYGIDEEGYLYKIY